MERKSCGNTTVGPFHAIQPCFTEEKEGKPKEKDLNISKLKERHRYNKTATERGRAAIFSYFSKPCDAKASGRNASYSVKNEVVSGEKIDQNGSPYMCDIFLR